MGAKHNYQSRNFKDVTLFTKHSEDLVPKILETIKNYNPNIFVELGTFEGGFTLAVHEEFPELEIYSFDRKNYSSDEFRNKVFGNNVHFIYGDILQLPKEKKNQKWFTSLLDKSGEVITLLSNELGKIFLYCDNGHKITEMNLYSKYLKIGDIIGCHDWLCEIFPEDITEAIKDFELLKDWSENSLSRFWIKKR